MSAADHWRTILDLDSSDPQFSRGFELGTVWSLVRDPDYDAIDAVVSASNTEMLIRLGEATGRPFRATPVDDAGEWLRVEYGPMSEAREEELRA
jgi:hypothetical protein